MMRIHRRFIQHRKLALVELLPGLFHRPGNAPVNGNPRRLKGGRSIGTDMAYYHRLDPSCESWRALAAGAAVAAIALLEIDLSSSPVSASTITK